MKISEVNIIFIKPRDGLIGFASLIVDEAFYLGGIGIYQKLNGCGYRLTYPKKKTENSHTDIFHPINRNVGKTLENAILTKLNDVMKKAEHNAGYDSNSSA